MDINNANVGAEKPNDMLLDSLKQLYLKYGVIDENCHNKKLLHRCCPDAKACWNDEKIADQKMDESGFNSMQCPYVGQNYSHRRILFVGVNLHDCGGWDSIIKLFNGEHGVKNSLLSNQKKMTFGNAPKDYKGTLIFHRLAVYAHLLLNPDSDPSTYNLPELARTCEYIAFLEAIKCAPDDGKYAKPSLEMDIKCPQRYLFEEIAILEPNTIVFFYKKTFDLYLTQTKINHQINDKFISYGNVTFGGKSIQVFRIIHPSRRGGMEIASQLKLLLRRIQTENEKGDVVS